VSLLDSSSFTSIIPAIFLSSMVFLKDFPCFLKRFLIVSAGRQSSSGFVDSERAEPVPMTDFRASSSCSNQPSREWSTITYLIGSLCNFLASFLMTLSALSFDSGIGVHSESGKTMIFDMSALSRISWLICLSIYSASYTLPCSTIRLYIAPWYPSFLINSEITSLSLGPMTKIPRLRAHLRYVPNTKLQLAPNS